MLRPTLFTRLERHNRILIAGAGGGFDVYAALPLFVAARAMGKDVFLASLSFTQLQQTSVAWLAPHLAVVTPQTSGSELYFPERSLAAWLAGRGLPSTVYAFDKVGVRPLRAAYTRLVEELQVEAVVLVDGGTDILMRGDEVGLGTPAEDMASLAAVSRLSGLEGFVASIGFGIDAFHGVCHSLVLENIASLTRKGGYLGAFSVTADSTEGRAYLDAVERAQKDTAILPSIVNGSIAAAIQGKFGDVRLSTRTEPGDLFINPLMGIYFTFDLQTVARQSLYLHRLEDTETMFDVAERIATFERPAGVRPWVTYPH